MLKSFFFISMIMSLLIIISIKESFLMFLISLEFLTLINLMILLMSSVESMDWLFMYYLILSVCEMVIGVSIMISMYKILGDEGFLKLSLKC